MKRAKFTLVSYVMMPFLILSLCSSCGDPINFVQDLGCVSTSQYQNLEQESLKIKEDMSIVGAWRLVVTRHQLICESTRFQEQQGPVYKELRSQVFYFETEDKKIKYIGYERSERTDPSTKESEIVGDWVSGQPLIIRLPLENDESTNEILKTTSLTLYVNDSLEGANRNQILNLRGAAIYRNNDETVMYGEFRLQRLGDD